MTLHRPVIPAKAGIFLAGLCWEKKIPAFAGMTWDGSADGSATVAVGIKDVDVWDTFSGGGAADYMAASTGYLAAGATEDAAAFSVARGAGGSFGYLPAPKQHANAAGFLAMTSIGPDSISARTGDGALLDANEARESATLHSLQTQQQRDAASLSSTEQAPAWLMKLFR